MPELFDHEVALMVARDRIELPTRGFAVHKSQFHFRIYQVLTEMPVAFHCTRMHNDAGLTPAKVPQRNIRNTDLVDIHISLI